MERVSKRQKTLYLLCQPCNKLVYLFKTPSKCLFWVWDGWVSETAPDSGLYEPLLACLCAGFPRSADHFPLLLPECDAFSVFSMIIPNSGSYNITIQNPKHSFKTKPKILLKWSSYGEDVIGDYFHFFILLPCLGLFNGLLCVSIGISVWSLPSRSPQTGMLHQKGETSERKATPPHYHRHEEIIKCMK